MSESPTDRTDLRALPAYTVQEASRYLAIPAATVRSWSVGSHGGAPLIEAALIEAPRGRPTVLSFFNLTELHLLRAIRRDHRLKMSRVREAIRYLVRQARSDIDRRHPLLSQRLETDGLDLFVRHCGQLVNVSEAGQLAMREFLGEALRRIERDPAGVPIRLYPFTHERTQNASALIVIDPRLSAGRPVLAGTGIAAESIMERYRAGESIGELAWDYGRDPAEIEEAIRHALPIAA